MKATHDIIIIGGGPAGLTAALYAGRAGKQTAVLEKTVCGGQIINSPLVENYPGRPNVSGAELASDMYVQAETFGAEIIYDEAVSVAADGDLRIVATAGGQTYAAPAVIIATGRKNRPLGLEGEERLTGRGVSYCAACDGGFFRGKTTAVVGGGNTALHDALYLADICTKVYLIHRRNEFRGEEHSLAQLRQRSNVEFVTPAIPTALIGDDVLTALEVEQNGEKRVLEVSGVFVAIGQLPQGNWLTPTLELEDGYVAAGETCRTAVEGIFAAGDCRTKEVFQLSTAVADGTVAAMNALEYLNK